MEMELSKTSEEFKQMQVTITINSQKELDTLNAVAKTHTSVPEAVMKHCWKELTTYENVEDFCNSLRDVLGCD